MSRRAGWNKRIKNAACYHNLIERSSISTVKKANTWVLDDLVLCHIRMNAYNAGTYTIISNATTVARINTLLAWVSIPREVFKANHDGSISDPLPFVLMAHYREMNRCNDLHSSAQPWNIGSKGWIVESPILNVICIPLSKWEMYGQFHPMALCLVVTEHRWGCVT